MQWEKCDPLFGEATNKGGEDRHGLVDRPNLHNFCISRNLTQKHSHEKCDPLFGEDRYCPVDRHKLSQLYINRNFALKRAT